MIDKMQIVLDMLVNLKHNKGDIDKTINEMNNEFKKVNPDINLDTSSIKESIKEVFQAFNELDASAEDFESILSGIKLNIDSDEAKKAFDELEKMVEDINNIDLTTLEKALDNISDSDLEKIKNSLKDAFENFETNEAKKAISDLADQFEITRSETENLMTAQRKALAQLKATGKEGTIEYINLQKELEETSKSLKEMTDIADGIESIGKSGETFVDIVAKFEVLGNIGEKLSAFSEKGIEARDALLNLAGQTGVTGDELEVLKGKAQEAFVSGVGGSVGEATKAIATAKQMLGGFLDNDELTKFTVKAAAIGQVFDKDVNEVIAKSRTFIAQYGLEGEEAANLVAYAMQKGGSAMDDVLDTLDEYSQLAIKAGYASEEFTGILVNGVQAGLRDTDKLADSIKETQIRLNAGDTSKALDGLTSPITAQIQEIVKLGETGKISIKEMTQQSAELLNNAFQSGQITASIRDQFAVALSGTMAEDIGGEMWTKIFSQKIDTSAIQAQAKLAGEQIGNALGPVTMFEQIQKRFDAFATNASQALSPLISQAGGVLTSISSIAPAITMLQGVELKDVKENFSSIGSILTSAGGATKDFVKGMLSNLIPAFASAGTAGATAGATTAAAWGAALGPILLVVGAFAGIVGLIKLISSATHETAKEQLESAKAQEEGLKTQQKTLEAQKQRKKDNLELIKSYEELGKKSNKTQMEEEQFRQIQVQLSQAFPGVISGTKTFAENMTNLKGAVEKGKNEIQGIDKQLKELDANLIKARTLTLQSEVNVSKENIEDQLTEAFSNVSMQWDAGSEWLTGSSDARRMAEDAVKQYTDAIYQAQNSSQLADAGAKFQMALWNDKSFEGVPEEMKAKLVGSIEDMMKKQGAVIEQQNKINNEKMQKGIQDAFKDGVVSEGELKKISDTTKVPLEEVQKYYDELKAKAKSEKIGEILQKSAEIKGNLDGGQKLNDLVKQFENAKTDIERASIAEAIKKQAPDAIKATGSVITAEGKLVNTYSIVSDKIKESSEAQKGRYSGDLKAKQNEFIKTILQESDAYAENITEMNRLKTERDKLASQGLDTSKIDTDINALGAKNQKIITDMTKDIIKWEEKGLDSTEIYNEMAKTLGKSPEEVKKLIEKQKETILKQKEMNKEATKLADIFGEAQKKSQDQFNQALNESKSLILKIRDAKAKGNKEDVNRFSAELKEKRALAKEYDKQLDKINAIGESEESRYNQEGKSAYELAKIKAENAKYDLELKAKQNELNEESNRILEGREITVWDNLLAEKNRVKLLEDQKKVIENEFKIIKNSKGEIEVGIKAKPEEKSEVIKELKDLNLSIQEAQNSLKGVEIQIGLDRAEVDKQLQEYELNKTIHEIELGLKGAEEFDTLISLTMKRVDLVKNQLESSNSAISKLENKLINELNNATDDEQKQAIQNKYDILINEERKKNLDLLKSVDEAESKVDELYQKRYDYQLNKIQSQYDKEKELLDKKYSEIENRYSKFSENMAKGIANLVGRSGDEELNKIDAREQEKLKKLQQWQELGVISAEDFEKRKSEIEYRSAKERERAEENNRLRTLRNEAFANGMQLQMQREKEAEYALIEKKKIKAEISAFETRNQLTTEGLESILSEQQRYRELETQAREYGLTEQLQKEMEASRQIIEERKKGLSLEESAKLDALSKQWDEINKVYKEKTDLISITLSQASEGVSEAMGALLAGDPKAATDALRSSFAQILGTTAEMLRKEIDLLIVNLLIDWFKDPSTQAIPFWVKMGLIPLTQSMISGLIHGIADPMINNVIRMPTGGEISSPYDFTGVYNQPTYLVGDGSKLGAPNTEYVLNHPQLKEVVKMSAREAFSGMYKLMGELIGILKNQSLETELSGNNIRIAMTRDKIASGKRSR